MKRTRVIASLARGAHDHSAWPRLARLFARQEVLRHLPPGAAACVEGEPVTRAFRVESGWLRCCTVSEEGRRQIFRFVGIGEFIGLTDAETWHHTAEAVGDVTLSVLSQECLADAVARDAGLEREIRLLAAAEIHRLEQHMVVLAFTPAEERVLSFLTRISAAGTARDGFAGVPMTRNDIGDHLGLSLETVSRAFAALRRRGAIDMDGPNRVRLIGARASTGLAA